MRSLPIRSLVLPPLVVLAEEVFHPVPSQSGQIAGSALMLRERSEFEVVFMSLAQSTALGPIIFAPIIFNKISCFDFAPADAFRASRKACLPVYIL